MIPRADNDHLVRQAAFALLVTRHKSVMAADLARVISIGEDVIDASVDRLAALRWIDLDDDGHISGADGLSLTSGPHQLTLDEGSFQTWCAYDALGIAAALQADATINTACAVCGDALTVIMHAGRPTGGLSNRLWLADGGGDLRADFCSPTVLLCSAKHAAIWAARNSGRGRALGLDEAASLGADAWAQSAHLARAIGSSQAEG